jgi:hypothetical protein
MPLPNYKYRNTSYLTIWEAARIMRDLGLKRFNYRLRDAVKDGVYAQADEDWERFYGYMIDCVCEWGADSLAAIREELT